MIEQLPGLQRKDGVLVAGRSGARLRPGAMRGGGNAVDAVRRHASSPWSSPDSRWPGWWCPPRCTRNDAAHAILDDLTEQGVTGRSELVLVDRGLTAAAAAKLGRRPGVEVHRVGWHDKRPVFRLIQHAWRVEVAHGRLCRSQPGADRHARVEPRSGLSAARTPTRSDSGYLFH